MMRIYGTIAALTLALATSPAFAKDTAEKPKWRASASGGTTLIGETDDQSFVSTSITRQFEDGYVQIGASFADAGMAFGLFDAVPASTKSFLFAAGKSFGDISVDGYAGFGRRSYDPEPVGPNGQRATVASKGSSVAAGITLTYDVELSNSALVSPFVSVDYHRVDIGRVVTSPSGNLLTIEQRQGGWSGSAGLALQQAFGPELRHAISPYVSYATSSDSTGFTLGPGAQGLSQMLAVRSGGQRDSWLDYGATASLALNDRLRLRLSASQTSGFVGPEATSLTGGISMAF